MGSDFLFNFLIIMPQWQGWAIDEISISINYLSITAWKNKLLVFNQLVQSEIQKNETATENVHITLNTSQNRHGEIRGKLGKDSAVFKYFCSKIRRIFCKVKLFLARYLNQR